MRVMIHPDPIARLLASVADLLAAARVRHEAAGTEAALQAATRFVDSFDAPPPVGAGFKYLPPEARALHADVLGRHGQDGAAAFLFVALLVALERSLASPRLQQLPARVLAHQLRHYERIVTDPEPTMQACVLDSDLFLKEFGLASLRMVAAGSNLVDVNSGVGRSLLWKNGLRDLPRRLAIFARLGGFRPFFQIHAHKFHMAEFNEAGRNECYRCCAELYALHPEVRGMMAGSWFYDPVVARISPRLAYLREVPERGGAHVLFDSFNEEATGNAVAASATRRKLVESGQYRPAGYVLLWPRARQIAWARAEGAA